MEDSSELCDGFKEVLVFRGHHLRLRAVVDGFVSASTEKHPLFLSVDPRRLLLWSDRGVVARFGFPPLIREFVVSVVYLHGLRVFLAAAADMSFKVFDTQLRLVESIRHEERTITSLGYDEQEGVLVVASAEGVSLWRVYRNVVYSCHVIERLFRFTDCSQWVSRLICDFRANRLYALVDRSVYVLGVRERAVLTLMQDVHDCPVTQVVWIARSRSYLTGCSEGKIKLWTTRVLAAGSGLEERERLYLLHAFGAVHSKAVTGLALHPIPGLVISGSLDGWVKVINLETFGELLAVRLAAPVTSLRVTSYLSNSALVLALGSGEVRVWHIRVFLQFFAQSSSNVRSIRIAPNLLGTAPPLDGSEADGRLSQRRSSTARRSSTVRSQRKSMASPAGIGTRKAALADGSSASHTPKFPPCWTLVRAEQDLRVLGEKGESIGGLEPQYVVEGVEVNAASPFQQLLFCVHRSEAGQSIRVFDVTLPDCALIREIPPGIPETDVITCMSLTNVLPSNCVFSGSRAYESGRVDLRGNSVINDFEEVPP